MANPVWHQADQKSVLGATTSETVARPDNVAEGDLVVVVWMLRQQAPALEDFTVPSGFVLWHSLITGDSQSPNLLVWAKVATASEPVDYTFSYTGTATENALLAGRVTGFDATVNLQVEVSSTTAGTSLSLPAWTDSPNLDYLRLAFYACRTSSGAHNGVNVTAPVAMAELFGDASRDGFSAAAWTDSPSGRDFVQVDAENTNVRWNGVYLVIREDLAVDDPPPVTSGIVVNVDAKTLVGYADAEHAGTVEDRSTGRRWDAQGVGLVYDEDGIGGEPALRIGEAGADTLLVRDEDGPVEIAAGSGFTMFVVWHPLAWFGSNPGIWRSGVNADGNYFQILQGTDARPWTRWAGTDVLQPTSGYGVGRHVDGLLTWQVGDQGVATFRADEVDWYSEPHAAATAAFEIHRLGRQDDFGGVQRADARYGQILMYDRELSVAERDEVESWLIERWGLAQRDEVSFGTGVWSWFQDPRALRYVGTKDQTYVTYVSDTALMVAAYNHGTGELTGSVVKADFQEDDHAVAALRVKSDGRLQVFYSEHNGATMFHRTSTNPEDVSAWDAEQSELFGTSDAFNYPNPIDLSDRVVLHWRRGTGLGGGNPNFAESTDDGDTWGGATELFATGNTPYLKCAEHPGATDRIDYVLTNDSPHGSSTKNSLYHFYREDGSYYRSDGTLIGDGTALPLAPADVTTIWDGPTEGEDCWQWGIAHDDAGNPVIVFAKMSDDAGSLTDDSIHTAMYARWNGTSWDVNEIAPMGKTIARGQGEPGYSAGCMVDPEDVSVVWVAVEANAGVEASLHRYTTSDGGTTWTGEQVSPAGTEENVRPLVPINRHSDFDVVYVRGDYDHWTAYQTTLLARSTASANGGDPDPPAAAERRRVPVRRLLSM